MPRTVSTTLVVLFGLVADDARALRAACPFGSRFQHRRRVVPKTLLTQMMTQTLTPPSSLTTDDATVVHSRSVMEMTPETDAPSAALRRLATLPQATVWTEFGELARSLRDPPCNLGQGYPDWAPPPFALDAVREACAQVATHQYARSAGYPDLVETLAKRYTTHLGRPVDPYRDIAVTVGATQALLVALLSLVDEDDEVVVLEPFFDLYWGQISLSGATPKAVAMTLTEDRGFGLPDPDALAAALSSARVLVLNSPHNPSGTVFSDDEMRSVAKLVLKENERRKRSNQRPLYVISDEVYKYVVHDNTTSHVHFAALPGMADYTLTVSSAGKTFSATGWQIGWIVGPPHPEEVGNGPPPSSGVIAAAHRLLPYLQFCAATPMQAALALALKKADEPYEGFQTYYHWLRDQYRRKRKTLVTALEDIDLKPLPGQGGYFVLADIAAYVPHVPRRYLSPTPAKAHMTPDWAFCRWLAVDFGLVAIPASPFFSNTATDDDVATRLVRFAFCKTDPTLETAVERLQALRTAVFGAPLPEVDDDVSV